jgi:ATP-binding cassette subfamily C protein
MKTLLVKLAYIIDKKRAWQLVGLFCLTLGGTFAETLGIGVILPFIYLLTEPDILQENMYLNQIYTAVGASSVAEFLIWISVGIIIVFVLKNLYLGMLTYWRGRFIAGMRAHLSQRMLGAYLYSPYTFYLQRNTAEIIRNINNEAASVCQNIVMKILVLTTDILMIISIGALIILVDPLSFLIVALLLGIFTAGFYRVFQKRVNTLAKERQTISRQRIKSLYQGLNGIKESKTLGREQYFVDIFAHHSRFLERIEYTSQTINVLPRLLNETLMVSSAMFVIISALIQGRDIQTILPTLLLFAAAAYRLIPKVSQITISMASIRANFVSLDVVYDDLVSLERPTIPHTRERSVLTQQADHEHPAIVLNDVSYRYPEATTYALRDVTMTVPKNISVGLVGASGAGKTTLVDIILGLLPPTTGHVLVYGHDLQEYVAAWRQIVGYIPQNIYLTDDTIRSNVAFGLPEEQIRDEQVWNALEIAQLKDLVLQLPKGLHTLVGERGVRLSGGQRQRIGIARALYHNPEVLVMDEATAALDNETERSFVQAIEALREKKTIVIIAHRLSTVRSCDQLYLLKDGKVVDVGTYDELLRTSSDFKSMVGAAS